MSTNDSPSKLYHETKNKDLLSKLKESKDLFLCEVRINDIWLAGMKSKYYSSVVISCWYPTTSRMDEGYRWIYIDFLKKDDVADIGTHIDLKLWNWRAMMNRLLMKDYISWQFGSFYDTIISGTVPFEELISEYQILKNNFFLIKIINDMHKKNVSMEYMREKLAIDYLSLDVSIFLDDCNLFYKSLSKEERKENNILNNSDFLNGVFRESVKYVHCNFLVYRLLESGSLPSVLEESIRAIPILYSYPSNSPELYAQQKERRRMLRADFNNAKIQLRAVKYYIMSFMTNFPKDVANIIYSYIVWWNNIELTPMQKTLMELEKRVNRDLMTLEKRNTVLEKRFTRDSEKISYLTSELEKAREELDRINNIPCIYGYDSVC